MCVLYAVKYSKYVYCYCSTNLRYNNINLRFRELFVLMSSSLLFSLVHFDCCVVVFHLCHVHGFFITTAIRRKHNSEPLNFSRHLSLFIPVDD